MVVAYILIQTEVGKAVNVAEKIVEIEGVQQAEDVIGPYDVVVRAEANTIDDWASWWSHACRRSMASPEPSLPGGPPLALLDQAATTCPLLLLLALCDGATSG